MDNIFFKKKTYIYLLLSIILILGALIVTISDNPPGIILSYISSVFFVLAFTHNFEKPKSYVILLIISIVGFVLFAILHNVFEVIGQGTFLESIGAFFFIAAVFLCPAGVITGIVGMLVRLYKKKVKYSS